MSVNPGHSQLPVKVKSYHGVVSATVVCEQLNVTREKNHILYDLNLEIPRGLIMGLLGPSGSGKTTLMRAMAGLQVIESGQIRVLDLPAGSKALRHKIAYSTQSASVYSDLTCIENIKYFASLYDHNEKTPEQILHDVDLTSNAKQMAGSLSGGERARLALATTLVGAPELLILDEPTVGLHFEDVRKLIDILNRLVDKGNSVMVIEHNLDMIKCADWVIDIGPEGGIGGGNIVAQGTPEHVAGVENSHTGKYLKKILKRDKQK